MEPYRFTRHNRTPRAIAILICVYGGLLAGIVTIDLAWWLAAVAALFTVPMLWDIYRDTSAGLAIKDEQLHWYTGNQSAALALAEIDHARFDTRWDFSVRVTLQTTNGKSVRLPYEALPPHRDFEHVLQNHGVTVNRHHFRIF